MEKLELLDELSKKLDPKVWIEKKPWTWKVGAIKSLLGFYSTQKFYRANAQYNFNPDIPVEWQREVSEDLI